MESLRGDKEGRVQHQTDKTGKTDAPARPTQRACWSPLVPRGATLCTRAHFTPNSTPNSFLRSNLGDKKAGLHLRKNDTLFIPYFAVHVVTPTAEKLEEVGQRRPYYSSLEDTLAGDTET